MAEENSEELEGFDDLDGLLDEDAGGGGGDEDFAGELDDFLGADDAGGDDMDAGGDEEFGGADEFDTGGGDEADASESELDSFFEDLSTIDDLEVTQEEMTAEAAPEEIPVDDMESAAEMAAAAPVAAAAVAAAPDRPTTSRPWRRRFKFLILLGLLGGGAYYANITFFPEYKVPWPEIPIPEIDIELPDIPVPQLPWPLVEDILEEEPLVQQQAAPPPPPAEPSPLGKLLPPSLRPEPETPDPSRPVPRLGSPPPKGRGYGVQVATCFFAKCVKGYQKLLARNSRTYSTAVRGRRNESLEIVSGTVFDSREIAEEMAVRINRAHRLEGQAYVVSSGGGFKISMGTFPDLSRASLVRDSLNQRMEGQVFFSSRLKTRSYKVSKVITGRYASRGQAQLEMRALRSVDLRFRDAFIVRN